MKLEINKEQEKWYLITIDDPSFLSQISIKNMINFILKIVKFNYIIMKDIQGSGKDWVISNVQKKQGTIFNKNEFFLFIDDLKQLDWGDFFLYKEYPKQFNNNDDYPQLIAQTDTTLRLIDSQYFYIYTSNKRLIESIKNEFKFENIIYDYLSNQDYPF